MYPIRGRIRVYTIHYYFSCNEFFTPTLADGLSMGLTDSKSPQISRTLFSILADLNNSVVYIDSIRPPISHSSRLFSKLLGII